MIIETLWIKRQYEDTPELLVAWDEFSVDENPEGFAEDCASALLKIGDDLAASRQIQISVLTTSIDAAFVPSVVTGVVI